MFVCSIFQSKMFQFAVNFGLTTLKDDAHNELKRHCKVLLILFRHLEVDSIENDF